MISYCGLGCGACLNAKKRLFYNVFITWLSHSNGNDKEEAKEKVRQPMRMGVVQNSKEGKFRE